MPPFNRFDPDQPLVRDGAVYVPSYPPFYAPAGDMLHAVRRVIRLRPGTWLPLTLPLGWRRRGAGGTWSGWPS